MEAFSGEFVRRHEDESAPVNLWKPQDAARHLCRL